MSWRIVSRTPPFHRTHPALRTPRTPHFQAKAKAEAEAKAAAEAEAERLRVVPFGDPRAIKTPIYAQMGVRWLDVREKPEPDFVLRELRTVGWLLSVDDVRCQPASAHLASQHLATPTPCNATAPSHHVPAVAADLLAPLSPR